MSVFYDKGKPGETRGRKATGPMERIAGLPKKIPQRTSVFGIDAEVFLYGATGLNEEQ